MNTTNSGNGQYDEIPRNIYETILNRPRLAARMAYKHVYGIDAKFGLFALLRIAFKLLFANENYMTIKVVNTCRNTQSNK